MARLKSRNLWPPGLPTGGFQLLIPEVGMKQPIIGSFNEVVSAFDAIVRKNPALAQKQGWPTTRFAQESFIDQREAMRMLAHGWTDFVDLDSGESAPAPTQKKTLWQSVAGGVKRVVAGAQTLLIDWLGENKLPVARELAEARALVCSDCPGNDGGDLKSYFTEPVSNQIRHLLAIKHDLNLTTPYDDKLTVCSRCDCPLKLKVWSPMDVIVKRMSPETRQRLEPRCWVLKESSQ